MPLPLKRPTQFAICYWLLAILAVLYLRGVWVEMQQVEAIPYSDFQQYLKDGRINKVVIRANTIEGEFTQPVNNRSRFVTTRVEPDMAAELDQYGVAYSQAIERTFLRDILSWVLPAVFFVAIWMFLIRRMAGRQGLGGGFLEIGKSKARVYMETDTKVTFDDVAGVDEAKEELKRTSPPS